MSIEQELGSGICYVKHQESSKEREKMRFIRKLLVQGVISSEFEEGRFLGYKDRAGSLFLDEEELISCYMS